MARPYFRKYETPAPRDWPLWAIAALACFDVALIAYLAWQVWGPR